MIRANMQTTESFPPSQGEATEIDPVSKALGLLVVGLWGRWYNVKNKYLGAWIAGVVLVFSLIELPAPLLHVESLVRWLEGWLPLGLRDHFRSFLIVLLMVAAFAMFYSHRRLEQGQKGMNRLIYYLKWLTEYEWSEDTAPLVDRLTTVLDGLLGALQEGKETTHGDSGTNNPNLNASILIQDPDADRTFMILAQDSKRTFDPMTRIPLTKSVAGKVVEKSKRGQTSTLIYVPWTRFAHGWLFRSLEDHKITKEMEFIETPFCPIEHKGQEHLKCLLCVCIPLEPRTKVKLEEGDVAVPSTGEKGDAK